MYIEPQFPCVGEPHQIQIVGVPRRHPDGVPQFISYVRGPSLKFKPSVSLAHSVALVAHVEPHYI